jgi:hypothetical protein
MPNQNMQGNATIKAIIRVSRQRNTNTGPGHKLESQINTWIQPFLNFKK